MSVTDYNGEGPWSREGILSRYAQLAAELGITPQDLSPQEHFADGRHWIYPVMERMIAGIESGDRACIALGIDFIEEDKGFPFGKILKSNTARALRRASLSDEQKKRVRSRVFALLRSGNVPHEFREYAKLVRSIGYDASEVPEDGGLNPRADRFRKYFKEMARRPHT